MILCCWQATLVSAQYLGPDIREYLVTDPTFTSVNVANTGTDMVFAEDLGCWLQVSVWDGAHAGFGWRIGNAPANADQIEFSTDVLFRECEQTQTGSPNFIATLK